MKLIVGLGNPGARYAATRHNIGFRVVRYLATLHRVTISRRQADAVVGEGTVDGVPALLALPQTFMNRSGSAVRHLCRMADAEGTELLVICDDVHLAVGALRLRPGGSAGGHRGLESIIEALGGDRFARLRVGVGRPPAGQPMEPYVLGPFPVAERPVIERALEQAADACRMWVVEGIEAAMNRWNAAENQRSAVSFQRSAKTKQPTRRLRADG